MLFSHASVVPKASPLLCNTTLISLILRPQNPIPHHASIFHSHSSVVSPSVLSSSRKLKHLPCSATPRKSDSKPDSIPNTNPLSKPRTSHHHLKKEVSQNKDKDPGRTFPTIPRKARRGRRSEAAAVEDFVRDRLEQTFESIKQNNPEAYEAMKNKWNEGVRKKTEVDDDEDDDDNDASSNEVNQQKTVIEEDSQTWPLDAEVGWGTRASDFFEKYPIKTVVGDDGIEIDWEGESDDSFIKEINCLEWESFAFHPSPLIVLVFERYNRATDNWMVLKELEKAAKVYWTSQDKLPPRTVKLDINIERDLAYALDVRECPQVLFLRGNRILYREREMRKADELVQLIAYFYYNAKKPSWINEENLYRPY